MEQSNTKSKSYPYLIAPQQYLRVSGSLKGELSEKGAQKRQFLEKIVQDSEKLLSEKFLPFDETLAMGSVTDATIRLKTYIDKRIAQTHLLQLQETEVLGAASLEEGQTFLRTVVKTSLMFYMQILNEGIAPVIALTDVAKLNGSPETLVLISEILDTLIAAIVQNVLPESDATFAQTKCYGQSNLQLLVSLKLELLIQASQADSTEQERKASRRSYEEASNVIKNHAPLLFSATEEDGYVRFCMDTMPNMYISLRKYEEKIRNISAAISDLCLQDKDVLAAMKELFNLHQYFLQFTSSIIDPVYYANETVINLFYLITYNMSDLELNTLTQNPTVCFERAEQEAQKMRSQEDKVLMLGFINHLAEVYRYNTEILDLSIADVVAQVKANKTKPKPIDGYPWQTVLYQFACSVNVSATELKAIAALCPETNDDLKPKLRIGQANNNNLGISVSLEDLGSFYYLVLYPISSGLLNLYEQIPQTGKIKAKKFQAAIDFHQVYHSALSRMVVEEDFVIQTKKIIKNRLDDLVTRQNAAIEAEKKSIEVKPSSFTPPSPPKQSKKPNGKAIPPDAPLTEEAKKMHREGMCVSIIRKHLNSNYGVKLQEIALKLKEQPNNVEGVLKAFIKDLLHEEDPAPTLLSRVANVILFLQVHGLDAPVVTAEQKHVGVQKIRAVTQLGTTLCGEISPLYHYLQDSLEKLSATNQLASDMQDVESMHRIVDELASQFEIKAAIVEESASNVAVLDQIFRTSPTYTSGNIGNPSAKALAMQAFRRENRKGTFGNLTSTFRQKPGNTLS